MGVLERPGTLPHSSSATLIGGVVPVVWCLSLLGVSLERRWTCPPGVVPPGVVPESSWSA
jgi:hypothetical protein